MRWYRIIRLIPSYLPFIVALPWTTPFSYEISNLSPLAMKSMAGPFSLLFWIGKNQCNYLRWYTVLYHKRPIISFSILSHVITAYVLISLLPSGNITVASPSKTPFRYSLSSHSPEVVCFTAFPKWNINENIKTVLKYLHTKSIEYIILTYDQC